MIPHYFESHKSEEVHISEEKYQYANNKNYCKKDYGRRSRYGETDPNKANSHNESPIMTTKNQYNLHKNPRNIQNLTTSGTNCKHSTNTNLNLALYKLTENIKQT